MPGTRQWTAEMNQCCGCHKAEFCISRAKLQKALSAVCADIIADETDGIEMGVIIVSCRKSG